MKLIIDTLYKNLGFKDSTDFNQSVFHVEQWKPLSAIVSFFTIVASFCEAMLGMKSIVVLAIIVLFGLELWTGIKASIKNGEPFESKKFPRGWVKLFIYFSFIFCANIFANHISHIEYGDFNFNHYRWIHYGLINFAIFQLFISNIENCIKLGWDEYAPLIGKIATLLKIKRDNK
jgi:hypothetical protein